MATADTSARGQSARPIVGPRVYLVAAEVPALVLGPGALHRADPAYDAVFPPLGPAHPGRPDAAGVLASRSATRTPARASTSTPTPRSSAITGYIIQMTRVFEIADRFRALRQDGRHRRADGQPAARRVPPALRRALRGRGRVHLAALPARVRRRAGTPTTTSSTRRSTCPTRRRRAWTSSTAATPTASSSVRAAARSPASSATSSSCTAARCASSRSSRSSRRSRPGIARGATQVFFADDNFVGNRAYAKELLRALAEWNARQRRPLSFYTQASIDMVRDEELLGLLRDANFISVFIGIESPRKASLAETHKTAERADRPGRGGPQDPVVQPVRLGRHDRRLRQRRRRASSTSSTSSCRKRRSRS